MGWMGPTAAVHNLFVDNLAREGIKIEVNELQNHCGVTGFTHPQLWLGGTLIAIIILLHLSTGLNPRMIFFALRLLSIQLVRNKKGQ